VEVWLKWGLIYIAALTTVMAIMSTRSAPFARIERLLKALRRIFHRR
jgi:hypothetical protein